MAQINEKSTVNEIKKFLDEKGIVYSGSASKNELLNLVPLEGDEPVDDDTDDEPNKENNKDISNPTIPEESITPDEPVIPDEPFIPDDPAETTGESWSDIIMGGNSKGGPTNSLPEENYYIVVEGDTLVAIANRFSKSVAKIKKLNNMTSNVVRVGRKLRMV